MCPVYDQPPTLVNAYIEDPLANVLMVVVYLSRRLVDHEGDERSTEPLRRSEMSIPQSAEAYS
jgi:hypothetical protein